MSDESEPMIIGETVETLPGGSTLTTLHLSEKAKAGLNAGPGAGEKLRWMSLEYKLASRDVTRARNSAILQGILMFAVWLMGGLSLVWYHSQSAALWLGLCAMMEAVDFGISLTRYFDAKRRLNG